MQSIIDAIEQWLKDFLIGAITGNLSSMFSDVNSKVATIATEVGKTPESWNSSVFSIILTLSRNVVVPIAGLVIAAVLTYELISMIIEKNNMHDIDTFMFFKWAFKSAAAAIIVNHIYHCCYVTVTGILHSGGAVPGKDFVHVLNNTGYRRIGSHELPYHVQYLYPARQLPDCRNPVPVLGQGK